VKVAESAMSAKPRRLFSSCLKWSQLLGDFTKFHVQVAHAAPSTRSQHKFTLHVAHLYLFDRSYVLSCMQSVLTKVAFGNPQKLPKVYVTDSNI